MSKTSGLLVSLAHTDKAMLKKVQPTTSRNGPSLPSISTTSNRQRKRSERLSSSSFLFRLMSIEEQQELNKQGSEKETDGMKTGDIVFENRPSHDDVFADESCRQWVAEQIFDKSLDTNVTNEIPVEPIHQNIQSRLPTLSTNAHRKSLTTSVSSFEASSILPSKPQDNQQNPALSYKNNDNSSNNYQLKGYSIPNQTRLKLPPLLLPPVYSVRPRPLKHRDFLRPTQTRGPIGEREWEELLQCRYLRRPSPRYALKHTPSQSSLQYQ